MENRRERERIKSERQRQEDVAFTKVVFWFIGAVVLMFLLSQAEYYYVRPTVPMAVLLINAMIFVGPVAAVVCAVMASKRQRGHMAFWAASILTAELGACAIAMRLWYSSGIELMNVLVPATTVLALIYYLYQREFFVISLVSGVGMLALWLTFRQGMDDWRLYAFLVVLGLSLLAVAVFARYLQTKGGMLSVKDTQVELLSAKSNYALIYITCALVALVIVVALLLSGAGSTMAYYAVPVAWLLVMAVYYTVKLM